MNLGLRILRAVGITLGAVVGSCILLVVWAVAWGMTSFTRQDIRVDTGEIREVSEGTFWDSSPGPSQPTVVTPVLAKYNLGMTPTHDPWVFFNRVHSHARVGGDYDLANILLETTSLSRSSDIHYRSPQTTHIHYGQFLEAVAKYRTKEQAALWWKALLKSDKNQQKERINRLVIFDPLLSSVKTPWTSQEEFDAWWKEFAQSEGYQSACKLMPELKEAP